MPKITYALLLATCFSLLVTAQTPSAPVVSTSDNRPASSKSVPANKPVAGSQAETASVPTVRDRAWDLLQSGLKEASTTKRATAVRVLSLLSGEAATVSLASRALADTKSQVRVAAAIALGELHATSAVPKLKAALSDKEPSVVLAAAHSLVNRHCLG
ncbi:MAG TPA: HEAT repeat domain-containing protein [Terriglobales bacterium]|nr:HEAT repeat domain-containing protein [Terriglobales bacterium]